MKDVWDLKAKNVVSNIRRVREYRNYTQDYLAAKLKVSQNAYSKVELGYSKLTVDRLYRIAVILNVNIELLITLNEGDLKEIIPDNKKKR